MEGKKLLRHIGYISSIQRTYDLSNCPLQFSGECRPHLSIAIGTGWVLVFSFGFGIFLYIRRVYKIYNVYIYGSVNWFSVSRRCSLRVLYNFISAVRPHLILTCFLFLFLFSSQSVPVFSYVFGVPCYSLWDLSCL